MESIEVNVIAKLKRLRDNLDHLNEDDKTFVDEMVKAHESGERLRVHQVRRIVDMRVPGEEVAQDSPIWRQGTVSVIYVPLEEVIWRYMPLEQLFALLWRKALHLSPLAVMGDTSE